MSKSNSNYNIILELINILFIKKIKTINFITILVSSINYYIICCLYFLYSFLMNKDCVNSSF